MKNILPLIKDFKRIIHSLFLLLAFSCAGLNATAQTTAQVSITLNILPPYSPYYSDYSGPNASKVLLIVRNLTSSQKRIKLTGELTGDNGIRITTKSNYVPLQPIILQPNETKQLNGTALKDIFDLNSLNVYGIDKVKLVQTSRIPEGNYSFCLRAVDMNTNQVITNTAPQGCTSFTISYPNAPILISPAPFEVKQETPNQGIIFSWMNAGVVPVNTQYIIQIAQMPSSTASDPNQVLNAATLPILNQRVVGTSYVYGTNNVPLIKGNRYAWRVIATDPSNKTGFMNDGKSQANVFIYGEATYTAQLVDIPIVLVAPEDFGKEIKVNNKNPLYLRWKFINIDPYQTANQIDYGFINNINKINDNTLKYKIRITNKKDNKIVDEVDGFDMPFYQEKPGSNKFIDGQTYEFVIYAYSRGKLATPAMLTGGDLATQLYAFDVMAGKSVKGSFIYKKISDVIDPLSTVKLKGKVQYEFDNDPTVYPITGQLRLTKFFKQIDDKGKIIKDYVSADKVNPTETSQYMVNINADGTFEANVQQTPVLISKGYLTCFSIDYPTNNYYLKPDRVIELRDADIIEVPFIENPNKPLLSANVGDFTSKVKAYKLNLHLSKGYNKSQYYNGTYKDNIKVTEALSGLQVTIYRENKNAGIPVYEGGQNLSPNKKTAIRALSGAIKNVIVIARDTTKIATAPGQLAEATVSFKQLLATANQNELYWIHVYNTKTNEVIDESTFSFKAHDHFTISGRGSFGENSVIKDYASEKQVAKNEKDVYSNYCEVEKNITWTVTQAPVATVKGRILYKYADGVGGARPLANTSISLQPFLVFTEKKAGGKTYVMKADFDKNNSKIISREDLPGNVIDPSTDKFMQYRDALAGITATITTNADGSFEFKNIPLWDSVAVAKSAYSFNIPGKKAPTPNTDLGNGINALKNGDKQGFIDAVKGSMTDPLRDPFEQSPMQNYLQTEASPQTTIAPTATPSYNSNVNSGFASGSYTAPSLNLGLNLNLKAFSKSLFDNPSNNLVTLTNSFTEFVPKHGPFYNPDLQNDKVEDGYTTASIASDGLCNVKLVYRVVINNKEVFCSPDDDILINPLQTLDVGVLNSVVKTAKVNAKLYDSEGYDTKTQIGTKLITNIPIELKRTEIVSGLQGEGETYNNVVFREKPATDKYMVDYGSSLNAGVDFNHVLINKIYSLEAIIHEDAQNSTSYKTNKKFFINKAFDVGEAIALGKDFIFNNEFSEPTVPLSIALEADEPIIAGRLMSGIKGLQTGAGVTAIIFAKSFNGSITPFPIPIPVDKDGYFSFKSAMLISGLGFGVDNIRVIAAVDGYTTSNGENAYDYSIKNMQRGQKLFKELNFTAAATIKGYVVNEKGEDIPALYQIVGDNYIQETAIPFKIITLGGIGNSYQAPDPNANKQYFNVAAAPNKPVKIRIVPNDLKYLTQELTYTPTKKGINDVGKVVVVTREHRIIFKITDINDIPVSYAQIKFLDKTLSTDANGKIVYSFMNISQDNFWVKVIPPAQSEYVPLETSIFSSDDESGYKEQVIKLQKGGKITGKVTLDGVALPNARVYVKRGEGATTVETTTGIDGRYTFYVPRVVGNFDLVAAGPNVGVIPRSNEGGIIGKTQQYTPGENNFNLTIAKGANLKKLLGYDINVEQMQEVGVGTNTYTINGSIDLNTSNGDFKLFDAKTRVSFNKLLVSLDTKNSSSLKPLVPTTDITLDNTQLKTRFDAAYNTMLKPVNSNTLIIKKLSANTGALTGKANIVDNSFNFPSSYLEFTNANFYFGVKENNTITNTISLFYTAANIVKPTYYFTNYDGNGINFKLLNFDATTATDQTYYNSGKIRLLPTITANGVNTLGKNLTVNLPQILIDQNSVSQIDGNKPIEFNLEKWTVSIPQWKLSTEEGGIVAVGTANVIKTGVLDIPFNTFRLRNDILLIDNAKLKSIKVGGIVDVNLEGSAKSTFGLDNKTGNDQKQHYILRILGVGGTPAGNIIGLKGMPDKVEIESATLVSSGEQYINFSPNSKTITAFKMIDFKPDMIESSLGSFSILGNVDLKIPRLPSFYGGFNYTSTTAVTPDFRDAIKFDIGKGYVQFNSPKINPYKIEDKDFSTIKEIKDNELKLYGVVYEPGNQLPEIPVVLTKTPNETKITYTPINNVNHVLPFDKTADGTNMEIIAAGTKVTNKDWDYLTFTGRLKKGNKALDGFDETKSNDLTFKVYGEIGLDNGKVNVKESTPFGDMTMIFDYPNKQIKGNITLNDFNVGTFSVSGEAEMMIGKNGFYTFFAGDINYPIPVIFPLKAGLLLGVCSELEPNVIPRVMQFSHNKLPYGCNPEPFAGLLIAGRKDVFDPIKFNLDLPPLVPLVSVGLIAECGVDAAVFMNFAKKTVILQAGAFGNVRLSLAAITGTSATGNVGIDVNTRTQYTIGKFPSVNFCTGVNLGFNVKQTLLGATVFDVGGSIDLSVKATISNQPKFQISKDSCLDKPDPKCATKISN